MKWIGQHIYDLVARFRNDVYLEDLSTTTETNILVVDSDGKVSKNTTTIGDITSITEGDNITVTDPNGPKPTVALSTNVDVAGTLDVTDLGTFDASVTVTGKISLNDGGNSVFVGEDAGLNDDASANQNVGVGYQALRANTTGSANTANGSAALYSNTIGGANTANGHAALYSNTTGNNNIAVGYNAGTNISGGVSLNTVTFNSVFLGYGTKALASSQTNQIVIGYGATGLGSNTAILGNSSITTTRLQGGIEINASDTTITRVSAGRIAVEGVNVVTTSSTDTLTNKTLTAPTITGAGAIAGVFTGNITGNVTGDVTGNATTAGKAATISVTANNTTDETTYLTFVDGATGVQDIETDTDLTYNPSTNVLTAGTFAGALTGNVTGNVTGTAATVTGAAQASITSLGTLTGLTTSGAIELGHASDTTIARSAAGVVTIEGKTIATTNVHHHFIHAGWFMSYPYSRYIPLNGSIIPQNTAINSPEYVNFTWPYDGFVKTMWLRSKTNMGSTDLKLYKGAAGATVTTALGNVTATVGVNATVEFDFTSVTNTYSQGDTMAILCAPTENPNGGQNITIELVFDLTT